MDTTTCVRTLATCKLDLQEKIINPRKSFKDELHVAGVPQWLWALTQVKATEKVVYARLMSYANLDTGVAFVRQSILASDCGISQRQVVRSLQKLVDHGLIYATRMGQGRANSYCFRQHEWMAGIDTIQQQAPENRCQSVTSRSDKLSHPEVTDCHFSPYKAFDFKGLESKRSVAALCETPPNPKTPPQHSPQEDAVNVFNIVRSFTDAARDDGWEVDKALPAKLGGIIKNYQRKGYSLEDIQVAVWELIQARDPDGQRYPVEFLGQFLGEPAAKNKPSRPLSNAGYFSNKRPALDANQFDDPNDKPVKAMPLSPELLLRKEKK